MNTSNNSEQRSSAENKRIVVLDTETTGMNTEGGPHYLGHRIVEIGAVEIINRKLTGRHFPRLHQAGSHHSRRGDWRSRYYR